jgi:hypothetical protein
VRTIVLRGCVLVIALIAATAAAWPQRSGPSEEQGRERCRDAAQYMISLVEQSLTDPSARPERVEKRRTAVADWKSRLAKGEDPCVVHRDISKAVTTL